MAFRFQKLSMNKQNFFKGLDVKVVIAKLYEGYEGKFNLKLVINKIS